MRKRPGGGSEAFQLQIALQDTKPLIWRRVLVPSTITFAKLHKVIQLAMGWTDSHRHRFLSQSAGPMKAAHEKLLKLNDFTARGPGSCFFYEYDPGDGWLHLVVLEKSIDLGGLPAFVDCIEGARACPPENCGGVEGYEELLAILADPSHPEHRDRLEWVGAGFDPARFDREIACARLRKLKPQP